MGRKCSVHNCKTGYSNYYKLPNQEKITVYGFPQNIEECQRWASSLPNKLSLSKVTANMGVCALHWPPDANKIRAGRYLIPSVPPSVFSNSNIPESCASPGKKCKKIGIKSKLSELTLMTENRDPEEDETEIELFLDNDLCLEETHHEPAAAPNPLVVSCDDESDSFWNEGFNVCWGNLKQETPLALEISQKLSELKNNTWNILAQHGYGDRIDEGMVSQIVDLLLTDELQTRDQLAVVLDVKPPSLTVVDAAIRDGCVEMSSLDPTLQTQRSSAREPETAESGGLEEAQSDEDTLLATRPAADNDTTCCPESPIASPSSSHRKDRETVSLDEPPSSPHLSADGSTSPLHSPPDVAAKEGGKEEKCILCGQVFPENYNSSEHLKNCWENFKHTCPTCGETFPTPSLLQEHMDTHSNSHVKCRLCAKRIDKKAFQNHLNKHRSYTCTLCAESFYLKKDLAAHTLTHRKEKKEKPTKCSICDEEFKCPRDLVHHNRRHNIKEKLFKCSECTRSFCSKLNLLRHSLSHKRDKLTTNQCPVCDKTFPKIRKLKQHMRIHKTDMRYKCLTCDKGFYSKSAFDSHMTFHTRERLYLCSICGKAVCNSSVLRKHMKLHSGEKPHTCVTCGKAFSEKFMLTNHMRRHTGEKPFQCSTCGKSFIVNHELTTHKRIHTGEKPFKCLTCGKKFHSHSNRWIHSKQAHKGH